MAFSIKEMFGTSPTKEIEGVWFTLDEKAGAMIKIAAENNPHAQDFVRRKLMRDPTNRHLLRFDSEVSIQKIQDLDLDTIVECIVTGWENITEDGGKILPYSKDNARYLLTTYPRMMDFVREASRNLSRYQDDVNEDALGNSPRSSNGPSDMVETENSNGLNDSARS